MSRLDSGNDDFFYRGTTSSAPNLESEISSHEEMYRLLYQDYMELLNSAFTNQPNAQLSPLHSFRIELARQVYGHSFTLNLHFSNLLTIFHNQLWDHRYVNRYLFSTYVDPKHRPLESIQSMSGYSVRASKVIDRLTLLFSSEMIRLTRQIQRMVNTTLEITNDSDLNSKYSNSLDKIKIDRARLSQRMESLGNHLYSAVQFSNDILRDHKAIADLPSLESKMAELGEGLGSVLKFLELYQAQRGTGAQVKLSAQDLKGIILPDPVRDLDELFGVDGHVIGRTMYADERGAGDGVAYSIYGDTVVTQYILAAGSLMAKISEIPEGRGSSIQKLGQELRFRGAQVTSLLSAKEQNSHSRSTIPKIYTKPIPFKNSTPRRNFAAPSLLGARVAIEDQLWKVFFETSGLNQFEKRASRRLCEQLLMQKKKKF